MPLNLLPRFRPKEIKVPLGDLVLRTPQRRNYEQWVKLRGESADFLRIWEPKWPPDDLTLLGYQRRLRSYSKQRHNGTGYTFFLFEKSSNQLLGGISLSHIVREVSRSGTLGYWMGVRHANKGHMSKALPAILDFAFNDLNLRRVEAATLPRNERSIHLLGKCGFQREGYAREYLEINGIREDHILFACCLIEV